MADARADDALERRLRGERLSAREPKVPYNGAEGVPIREEVLARHGDFVVTRNAYGAHCLNVADCLIADIDLQTQSGGRLKLGVLAAVVLVAIAGRLSGLSGGWTIGLSIAWLILSPLIADRIHALAFALRGGARSIAERRIEKFMARHPDWGLRLYRTPAGWRAIVSHRGFDPSESAVLSFFEYVRADSNYVRMCRHQRCFRARLTAKPWRIGIAGHMRPRPGTWPVNPAGLELREQWVRQYEIAAQPYAACRYERTLGRATISLEVAPAIELHDALSGALGTAPLA